MCTYNLHPDSCVMVYTSSFLSFFPLLFLPPPDADRKQNKGNPEKARCSNNQSINQSKSNRKMARRAHFTYLTYDRKYKFHTIAGVCTRDR